MTASAAPKTPRLLDEVRYAIQRRHYSRRTERRVRALHDADLVNGFGDVELPDAIARKYPRAPYE